MSHFLVELLVTAIACRICTKQTIPHAKVDYCIKGHYNGAKLVMIELDLYFIKRKLTIWERAMRVSYLIKYCKCHNKTKLSELFCLLEEQIWSCAIPQSQS
jgi:hypothetical protein